LALDTRIGSLRKAGLPAPSKVRMKLFTLDRRLIIRKIGGLSAKDQELLKENLRKLMCLSWLAEQVTIFGRGKDRRVFIGQSRHNFFLFGPESVTNDLTEPQADNCQYYFCPCNPFSCSLKGERAL